MNDLFSLRLLVHVSRPPIAPVATIRRPVFFLLPPLDLKASPSPEFRIGAKGGLP